MAVAKRRAVDGFRRDKMRERKHEEIARTLDQTRDVAAAAIEAAVDDDSRRRIAGPDLRGLPPHAVARRARGAHAQSGRRPDDGRDRPRVPVE